MGELDQLSMLLGEIHGDLKEAARQRGATFANIDEIKKMIAAQGGQILLLGQQMTTAQADHAALKKTISEKIEPQIEDYKSKKNRVIGLMLGIGGTGGGIGAVVTKWISGH